MPVTHLASAALTMDLKKMPLASCWLTLDLWLAKDNRFLNPKSSYKRILMAPPCRLIINCSNLLVISSIKCVLHAKEICDKPAQPSTSHRATNNLSGETGANVQVLPTVTNDHK